MDICNLEFRLKSLNFIDHWLENKEKCSSGKTVITSEFSSIFISLV